MKCDAIARRSDSTKKLCEICGTMVVHNHYHWSRICHCGKVENVIIYTDQIGPDDKNAYCSLECWSKATNRLWCEHCNKYCTAGHEAIEHQMVKCDGCGRERWFAYDYWSKVRTGLWLFDRMRSGKIFCRECWKKNAFIKCCNPKCDRLIYRKGLEGQRQLWWATLHQDAVDCRGELACSYKCRAEVLQFGVCPVCQVTFERTNPSMIYCGPDCRARAGELVLEARARGLGRVAAKRETIRSKVSGQRAIKTYFIQAVSGGPIKIGSSVDPEARLKVLQTSHHEPLRLVGTIDANVEAVLHHLFRKLRIKGEWFRPGPKLLNDLKEYLHDHSHHMNMRAELLMENQIEPAAKRRKAALDGSNNQLPLFVP